MNILPSISDEHPSTQPGRERGLFAWANRGISPDVWMAHMFHEMVQIWYVNWLVVWTPLKNMKVNWDDEIPNIWENKKWQPNQQPVILEYVHFYVQNMILPGSITSVDYWKETLLSDDSWLVPFCETAWKWTGISNMLSPIHSVPKKTW